MYYYYAKTDQSLYRFAELPEIGVLGESWHWTDKTWMPSSSALAPDVLFTGDYRQIGEEEVKKITKGTS